MFDLRLPVAPAAISLVFLLSACDRGPTVPAASHGLELSVDVGLPQLGIFSHPILTATLLNASDEEITVVFPNSCTLRPYIRMRLGDTAYPGWSGCYQVATTVTLARGRSTTRSVAILPVGVTPTHNGPSINLPPGQYVAYAELDGALEVSGGQRITLRARSVPFVQPEPGR